MLLLGCADIDRKISNDLPLFELVDELIIRSDDSIAGMSLTRVSKLSVLPDGRIATGHPDERRIRVFDTLGALSATFGRVGAGPFEIADITSLGSDSTYVWVYDGIQQKVVVFLPSGKPISEVSVPRSSTEFADGYLYFLGLSKNNLMWSWRILRRPATPSTQAEQGDSVEYYLAGARLEDRTRVFAKVLPPSFFVKARVGQRQVSVVQMLESDISVAVVPGGSEVVFAADPARWAGPPGIARFTRVKFDGTKTSFDVDFGARKVPDDYLKKVLARYHPDSFKVSPFVPRPSTDDVQPLLQKLREEYVVPTHYPVIRELLASRDGVFWVKHVYDDFVWSIVEENEVRKRVIVPAGFTLHAVSRSHAWGVRIDSTLELPIIVRARLTPRVPGR